MNGVTYEKNDCPCLSCIYLMQTARVNEKPNGEYSLKIYCSIAGCPKGFSSKSPISSKKSETHRRIGKCIKMLKKCIELKEKSSG